MTNHDLRRIIDESGLTVKEVSEKLPMDRSSFSTFLNKEEVKKISGSLERKIQRAFPAWLAIPNKHNTGDENDPNPTLLTLAESNKLHAESNIILARSHEKLVVTHERIVNLLEARLTADVLAKNEGEETAVLKTIRDLVLKVGVDAGSWKSAEEGMKVVHKIAGENAGYTKSGSRKHG